MYCVVDNAPSSQFSTCEIEIVFRDKKKKVMEHFVIFSFNKGEENKIKETKKQYKLRKTHMNACLPLLTLE